MASRSGVLRTSRATFDAIVVGSGIAGTSVAFHLAQRGLEVGVLEPESEAGTHSTGRSAALFAETYGPVGVRALTKMSRNFLMTCHGTAFPTLEHPIMTPRSILWATSPDNEGVAHGLDDVEGAEKVSKAEARELCPALREDFVTGGYLERDAMDMDVAALQNGFLAGSKQAGAQYMFNRGLAEASISIAGTWDVFDTKGDRYECMHVINAGGAWAEQVAAAAGVTQPPKMFPKRRTMFAFKDDKYADVNMSWPFLMDARVAAHETEGAFYFKPQSPGTFLASPADATPSEPCDAYEDDMDIAVCVESIMNATDLNIGKPLASWAGLRTFSEDGEVVLGEDLHQEKFFYMAGLGGYGVQTAPAAGMYVADLITELKPTETVVDELTMKGTGPEILSPVRFQKQGPSDGEQEPGLPTFPPFNFVR